MLRVGLALLAAAIFTSMGVPAAHAQQGVTVEDRRLNIRLDHRNFSLVTQVFRPPGKGPFPLVVIAHGTPAPDRLRAAELGSLDKPTRWFAEHGFIVVLALRPGFGKSDGPYMEGAAA